MSIPRSVKIVDCINKHAMLDREIMNGAGQIIPKGTVVKIVGVGRGVNIKNEPCTSCGQHCYIRNIAKSDLTLISEQQLDKMFTSPVVIDYGNWENEFYDNKISVWRATCSICHFESHDIYGKVSESHRFCEGCGAKMTGENSQ